MKASTLPPRNSALPNSREQLLFSKKSSSEEKSTLLISKNESANYTNDSTFIASQAIKEKTLFTWFDWG